MRALALEPRLEQIGQVVQVGDGVATVQGLPETRLDELLIFEGGVRGLAVDLGEEAIGCVLLGDTSGIPAGQCRAGTGEVARVPVGDALLGRVVDRARRAARRRRAAGDAAVFAGRAAGAGDRRPRAGDAPAGDRACSSSMP